jgi:general secretion pathway protein N
MSKHLTSVAHRSKTTHWNWAGAGVLVGVITATVLFAPARWLAHGVAQATGAQLQLVQPTGTVWHGSAQLVLSESTAAQGQTHLPGRVQWEIRPSLRGVQLALQAPCCLRQPWLWSVHPGWRSLQIDIADIAATQPSVWPTAVLAGLGTPWNTVQLQGDLALSTQQLSAQWLGGIWSVAGRAQLDARALSTSLTTLKPLGSYRLALVAGTQPVLTVSTLEGNLHLSGSGQWIGGRVKFVGEASAAPEHADALGNLLNIVGRRDGARSIITLG